MSELTNETKRSIYDRQNGMCAYTGKKFEEFNDSMEADFLFINPVDTTDNSALNNDPNNIVMVWNRHSEMPKSRLHKYIFSYANFPNYEAEDKAADVKIEVDKIVADAATTTDWKTIRNEIRDLTNNIAAVTLPATARSEFKDRLRAALTTITERQTAENEKNKELYKANFPEIKAKVDAAIAVAKEAQIFKEGRQRLITVQQEMRKTLLSREDRDELEKALDVVFKELNDKQADYLENFEMETIENYHNLRLTIDEAIDKALACESFNEAREILIAAQEQIKDKALKRSQKDEFFANIRTTFDDLREKFTEYKRITEEEAAENLAQAKPLVDAAVEFAKNATIDIAADARQRLIDTQNAIKDLRVKREQKDALYAAIREQFTRINEMTTEEREKFDAEAEKSYTELMSRIEVIIVDIENALDFRMSGDALAAISTEIQLSKLRKKHRGKLFDKLHIAFGMLDKRRDDYNKRRFKEKRARLEETANSLVEKVERMSKLIEKDNEVMKAQETKMDAIENAEDPKKLTIQKIIEEIKQRISGRQATIDQTNRRIEDIKNEIEKTNKQEADMQRRAEKRNKERSTANEIAEETKVEEKMDNPTETTETPTQE